MYENLAQLFNLICCYFQSEDREDREDRGDNNRGDERARPEGPA